MTRIRHSAVTHTGAVRKVNEDSILAMPDQGIWVVADGMGGHHAGDFASQTVVESVAAIPPGLSPQGMLMELRSSLTRAHRVVRAEAERSGNTVGSAFVLMAISNRHFVALWAGDCRLYRYRDGHIEMLTTDHSVVAEFVRAGQMTWDEVEQLPNSNAITRAVGVGDEIELDKIRGETHPGDRFLLCSDGLTKYANFATLTSVLGSRPIETVADHLLQFALKGGGADNISIIVVDVL